MDPVTLALIGGGLAGGLIGGHGRPQIDPGMLARLFGPAALAGDTQTLFQTIMGSPQFQAMARSASAMGANAGQNVRAGLARAGLGGSGIGVLSGAVSRQFGQGLLLNQQGNIWAQALQAATQNLGQRASIWGQSALMKQQAPTMAQQFGAGLTGMASAGLTQKLAPQPQYNFYTPETQVVSAPMRRINPTQVPSQAWR